MSAHALEQTGLFCFHSLELCEATLKEANIDNEVLILAVTSAATITSLSGVSF